MDKKRVLILGVSGQDGSFLAESCIKDGSEVYGMVRRTSTANISNLTNCLVEANFELVDGDMCDEVSLTKVINKIKPHEIYNLAGQSDVAVSFDQPIYTNDVNYLGVIRILEAIKNSGFNSRFYQAGSSEMFGNPLWTSVDGETLLNEDTEFNPVSPYAISKLSAYHIVKQYRDSFNMFACTGILFNHESERRGEKFVTQKICSGFKKINEYYVEGIRQGAIATLPHISENEKIHLGNLDAKRDWGYSPDYVEAMKLMLSNAEPRDYVIGTGETRSVREFVQICMDILKLPGKMEDYVTIDPRFFRPLEVNVLCADPSRAKEELGWTPETSFEQMVRKMLGVPEVESEGRSVLTDDVEKFVGGIEGVCKCGFTQCGNCP